jgi:YD repeat-containing protein
LPGIGKYLVNVANGNLLVQSDDVVVSERGIDLTFRRTYNSFSRHDASNTDGSTTSNFGNGWTNTFDAHIAFSSGNNILSIYDIDGARYDYTANSGFWIPQPGMQGTSLVLATQQGYNSGCYYQWTKKNGTTYIFYAPDYASRSCAASGSGVGLNGRVAEIFARNSNNYITFNYAWQGGTVDSAHLGSISVAHAGGQVLTLSFTLVDGVTPCNGSGPCELHSIQRPDGQAVTYAYDPTGNLTQVNRPGNNVSSTLSENYGYNSGTHQLNEVVSPRYAYAAANSFAADGTRTDFSYFSTDQVQFAQRNGVVNFVPQNDSTGTMLQPGVSSGVQTYYQQNFSGYASSPSCTIGLSGNSIVVTASGAQNVTSVVDTDGHKTAYTADGCWRLTQTQRWPDPTAPFDLLTAQSWDGSNDLIESVDARGEATDYAYDANGNTIAVALPSVQSSDGSFRPTSLYSYDVYNGTNYNNVTAYCEPYVVGATGYDWSNRPASDGLCTNANAWRYTWDHSDSAEPFGRVSDSYTPSSYHRHFSYDPNSEAGVDAGLPTSVSGDAITQQDGTTRTPTQSFVYDAMGNLTAYNKGTGAWSLTYDTMNRILTETDPDSITNYTCYYLNGEIEYKETAAQHSLDSSPSSCQSGAPAYADAYTYDADGDEVTATTHYGQDVTNPQTGGGDVSSAGVTTKWYDGEDRLVEVRQPSDTRDYYAFPWLTRYIYDLSQGGAVSISGGASGFHAYGNLYKTQECLSATQVTINESVSDTGPLPAAGGPNSCSFQDVRGSTFDALDRLLSKYEVAVGTSAEVTDTYDGNGYYGLLSGKANGAGQTDTLAYDNDGRLLSDTFNDNTPNRQFQYDSDGRTVSLTAAALGSQNRTYDPDGNLSTATAPSATLNGATITYGYYGDGFRKSLSLSVPSTGFNQTNLFAYSYRADGARSSLQVTDGSSTGAFAWTYTNAGRELTQSDPDTGLTVKGVNSSSPNVTYVKKTYSYDSFGRVASLQLPTPSDSYSSFVYDAESELYSDTPQGATLGIRYDYTARGELPAPADANGYVANGAICAQLPIQDPTNSGSGTCTFDSRADVVRSTYYTQSASGQTSQFWQSYSYDGAGRETADQYSTCYNAGAGCTTSTVTSQRTYDADNHVTSQTVPPGFQPGDPTIWEMPNPIYTNTSTVNQQYSWAADGHLATFQGLLVDSSGTNYQTSASYVWDGDDILLEQQTYSGSTEAYIDIEKLGFITPSGQINVIDRDWTGAQASDHSSSGFDAWNSDPQQWKPSDKQCEKLGVPCTGGTYLYHPPTTALAAARSDGYTDAFNNLQGVRAYDPNSTQWTTPDAYAGDVNDPMSQKPYMWNRNNPLAYQDPSGYEGCGPGTCGLPYNFTTPSCSGCAIYAQVSVGVGLVTVAHTWTTAGSDKNILTPGAQIGGGRETIQKGGAALASVLRHGASKTISKNVLGAAKSTVGGAFTFGVVVPSAGSSANDAVDQTHGGASATLCGDLLCVQGGVGRDGLFLGIGAGAGERTSISPPASSSSQPQQRPY